jgi:potassium channel subfamily K
MARRIRFEIAQPIIIIGWYISSALLIGILIPFGVMMYKPENDGRIYAQSYYYGAFAAGIYFIISSFMVATGYGAWRGHYSREYNLTTSQRTLMLQTIIFCIYLLGGAAVYAKIEHWRFLDALYWADYTLLTIGVGNFAPTTHLGRGLLFPYAVGGIIILGLIISSIRTLMLESGRQKIGDILTNHTHKFLVKQAFSDRSRLNKIIPPLGEKSAEAEGRSEQEQRKREFIAMRQVRELATVEHKWVSLLVSFILWMTMWLIGGVVFWRSESYAQWSYFQALYFAYTTLLTIGYGDLYPISSLGKSFFVFWSLLAVPTITILISSIGDTLVRFIRDVTLFIGEITILPGDQSFVDRIKDLSKISWIGWWVDETTGENKEKHPAGTDADHGRTPFEVEEQKKEKRAQERGDVAAENIHHYHYLIFRELRKMIEHTSSNPAKEFDYLEWEYFLDLIGGENKPDLSSHEHEDEGKAQNRNWSWLDKKNPLLGHKSEVEWLLEALTEALDRELKRATRTHDSSAEDTNRSEEVKEK